MTSNTIEIQRGNTTVAEFLNYVKWQCIKKGLELTVERDYFENPPSQYHHGYTVIDGKKKCHYSEYRTTTNYRRKLASYTLPSGATGFYYTNDVEAFEETKLHSWSDEWDGADAPCKSEIVRSFPYDCQTYILNFDGTCYNEICEFTFDDDKRGHGYYYQTNTI